MKSKAEENIYHVYPVAEEGEHSLRGFGAHCECEVRTDVVLSKDLKHCVGFVIVHRAFNPELDVDEELEKIRQH